MSTSSPGSAGKALKIWEEKLAYLLEQEAIASDAGQKFGLARQIEKAREKIRELKGLQAPEPPLRALHNLPYLPFGDLFTGRQEELAALEAATGTAAITQSAAISGLGGIGKTRLAVEYAWRSGNRYTAKWFVGADSPENLHRNLAVLAGPELLNLPEWEAGEEDKTVAAVRKWLREHPGWLMILDNVDTPQAVDAVLEVLPSLSASRVLITSRLTTWPATVRKQSLDKLSREEAVEFLLHRTKDEREPAADDAERAADLAKRVDGLPLALEQVAAYIIRHRMQLSEYLRAWEQEHDKLLQWYDPRVMQYPASVAVTWKQTIDRLSSTPSALLRLIAFVAPDPIPFEMLEKGAEHVQRAVELFCEETGTVTDGKVIREAIADLTDYSLVTRQDGRMLVIHRLVQEAMRSQISEECERDWIEGALRIIDAAAPKDPSDGHTWPVWNRLRPHVTEVVTRAEEVGIVEPTSRLMNDLGQLLKATDLYTEAEQWMRRALAFDEAAFGAEHPNVSTRLSNLARLFHDTNRLEQAEPLMRRALSIEEVTFGPDHPNVSTQLNNMAGLLKAMNRLEEAEPLMQRALSIDEAAFGNHHPRVAIRLNNLAALHFTSDRLAEAEPLMRRALAIDEAVLGNENPNVARDLNNLAWLLHDTNRLTEAEPLMRRAVEIWERNLDPKHPSTQAARRNLKIFIAEIAVTACVQRARRILAALFPDAYVRVQSPLALGDDSEPEPDLAIVQGAVENHAADRPITALLVVEVAHSSLGIGKESKIPLYARCGIPEVWLMNVSKKILRVHRNPGQGRYRSHQTLRIGDSISPLACSETRIVVADLFPA